jgi:hypothetical protein
MRFSRKLSRVQRPDQHGSPLGVQCLQLLVGCASYLPLAKLLCMSPHTPREHDSSPRSSVRRSSRDSREAFGSAAALSTVLGREAFGSAAALSTVLGRLSDWRDCDELLAGVNAVEAPSWYQYPSSGSNRLGWRRESKADLSIVAHSRLDDRAIVACSSTTWRTCASIQHGCPRLEQDWRVLLTLGALVRG